MIICVSIINLGNVYAQTYSNYEEETVSCGSGLLTGIPSKLPQILKIVYIGVCNLYEKVVVEHYQKCYTKNNKRKH